jgi:hypothetical protein
VSEYPFARAVSVFMDMLISRARPTAARITYI